MGVEAEVSAGNRGASRARRRPSRAARRATERAAIIAIAATLALGIGGNLVMFDIVDRLEVSLGRGRDAMPVSVSGAIASVFAVTVLAMRIPARRAASVDPMNSLRSE